MVPVTGSHRLLRGASALTVSRQSGTLVSYLVYEEMHLTCNCSHALVSDGPRPIRVWAGRLQRHHSHVTWDCNTVLTRVVVLLTYTHHAASHTKAKHMRLHVVPDTHDDK